MRPTSELELPLSLDRGNGVPLPSQLATALREALHHGVLAAGHQMPSSRVLAAHMGVARGTVLAGYEQLIGEGYLTSRHGSGTYVSAHLPPVAAVPRQLSSPDRASAGRPAATPGVTDLRPGQPDTSRVADPGWTRAWRLAARAPVPSVEPSLQGEPQLREEIAAHLRAARGVRADPEQVFVTAGTADGLALLIRALGAEGRAAVAVEDPGYPAGRRVLTRLGCTIRHAPVDDDGLDVEQLARMAPVPRAVLVTPSHQYPLGGRLPLERRSSLLAWAQAHDTLVIEDDYDSEFRFGVAPLPALAALDAHDRVAHVGTFSKVLTPWIRLGYLLAPHHLADRLIAVRSDLGTPVSGVDQKAMSTYLASGALRRHIARARRDYAHRRDHVKRLLSHHPVLRLAGIDAGLHAVIHVPDSTDVPAVLQRCRSEGFLLADLAEYSASTAPRPANAVVLGYGAASVSDLDRAIASLARAVSAS